MRLKVKAEKQPIYECLPTSLSAVFKYYGTEIGIKEIAETISVDSLKLHDWMYRAGTFALKNGFSVKIQTLVPYIFDPSWNNLSSEELIGKLKKESIYFADWSEYIKKQPKQNGIIYDNSLWIDIYKSGAEAAGEFLREGGKIDLVQISKRRMAKYLDSGCPIIFSHNPVILHKLKRAFNSKPDDIRGFSWGHIAVICGYDERLNKYEIADPEGCFYKKKMKYWVDQDLLLESVLRYNGELLIIAGKRKKGTKVKVK